MSFQTPCHASLKNVDYGERRNYLSIPLIPLTVVSKLEAHSGEWPRFRFLPTHIDTLAYLVGGQGRNPWGSRANRKSYILFQLLFRSNHSEVRSSTTVRHSSVTRGKFLYFPPYHESTKLLKLEYMTSITVPSRSCTYKPPNSCLGR